MRRVLHAIITVALWVGPLGGAALGAQGPAWWTERGVLSGDAPADFAPLTQGQLKWLATNACDELDASLALFGGAGSNVHAMVWGFGDEHDTQVVLVGQLKHVAQPLYDRLMAVGYADAYPWSGEPAEEADYALANIGQAKHLFDFELDVDTDEDGLPDWWEMAHFGHLDYGLEDDIDEDGLPDWWEMAHFGHFDYGLEDDADGDGVLEIYEYLHGTSPVDSASRPAGTHFVDPAGSHTPPFDTWATAATNIQAALDAVAADYAVVLVADGVYAGVSNKNLRFPAHPVLLSSTNGPDHCVIDSEWSGRGVLFDGGEDWRTVIANMTIRHGSNVNYGAGIYCITSSPTIVGCTLSRNWAYVSQTQGAGGGIAVSNGSPRIMSSRLEFNAAAEQGAGIFLLGSAVTITNCTLQYNIVQRQSIADNNRGGGIYVEDSDALITDCAILDNDAGYLGGGIAAKSAGAVIIRDSEFMRNHARLDGGGGYFNGVDSLHVERVLWRRNSGRRWGGALALQGSSVWLQSSVIWDNWAVDPTGRDPLDPEKGGALYMASGSLLMENCTILTNHCAGTIAVGGLYYESSAWGTNRNVIIWANTPQQIQTNSHRVVFTNGFIQGWTDDPLHNNRADDPRLLPGDFRLLSDSPCIDAGSDVAPALDIDGEARWDHPDHAGAGIVDVGADEFVDTDEDGMPDAWERDHFGNLDSDDGDDFDEDGLTNLEEYVLGTHPGNPDTDGDGHSDEDEILAGTNPFNRDTDGDGMPDGWEVAHGLDPLDPCDAEGLPEDPCEGVNYDQDGDGLTNLEEYLLGTDPTNADTDGGGISDGCEVGMNMDPTNASDGG